MAVNEYSRLSRFVFRYLFPMVGAFTAYCSMYAFRKPFAAGTFEGEMLLGIDYKILLISLQAMGYLLSKFIGIKVVSEMPPGKRAASILLLIGISWISLLSFAIVSVPYNVVFLFFNGLPLGMIWGLVFSYLEGRRNTELLGAGMSASFIISSGLVKSIGKYMVDGWQISEYWMPFLIGLMFVPLLLTGIWMLERTPPPDEADIGHRSGRMQMDKQSRLALFSSFSFGIVLVVGIYIALTIFRDIRDNFAVEIWAFLGQTDVASLLFWSEVPIALFVFTIIALMMYIRDNRVAFYSNLGIILLGGVILVFGTLVFSVALIGPVFWMIIVGFAMYLAYISYHTMLFERWFAHFRCTGNLGFFMYLADSFGYLGSLSVLLIKNFGGNSTNWLDVLIALSYIVGGATLILGGIAYLYFLDKEKKTEMGTLSISTAQKTF
jgi:hypothetical protein